MKSYDYKVGRKIGKLNWILFWGICNFWFLFDNKYLEKKKNKMNEKIKKEVKLLQKNK